MSSSTKQTDYSAALKDINEFFIDNAVSAFCPTDGSTLKFKPLSVRQMKSFMELQVSYESDDVGVVQGLKIVNQLNKILEANCLDENVNILQQLTVVDRDAIILQLRAHTNPTADIQRSDTNETESVNLLDIANNLKGKTIDDSVKNTVLTIESGNGSISVHLEIPTLLVDSVINKIFTDKIKSTVKSKKDFDKNASIILTQIYFTELCKYIKLININDTVIDFRDPKLAAKNLQLLESLPSSIVSKISGYVGDVKKQRDALLCYTNSNGDTVPLDIDANIFIGI